MYLFIFEDGTIKKTKTKPIEDDFTSCDNGYLTIIDMDKHLEWFNGWQDIEECE
jgi:hypothetical protein